MTDWQDTRTAGAPQRGSIFSAANEARARASAPQASRDHRSCATPMEAGAAGAAFAAGAAAARKLEDILDLLHAVPGAREIHRDALQALEELQQSCRQSEQHLVDAIDLLLRHQARRYTDDAASRTEVELLRRHFRPPLGRADTALCKRLQTLLEGHDDGAEGAPSAASNPPPGASLDGDPNRLQRRTDVPMQPPETADGDDGTRDPIRESDDLRRALSQEIRDTLSQNEEFGVTLDLVLSELRKVRSIDDAQAVRTRLLEQVQRLHGGHFALARKLDSADRYLRMLSLDSRHLNDELHRVRELSLTDELTSLPNRRAFMTRVEEEVARVERYGMPMSLAVIDLDRFKNINDQLGHAAGDEVLRCYATQIFSVFRNHDLVARYGGEEFAVLLPNTDHNGAAAALRKVRECATRVRSRAADTAFPVPTFSAGVATLKRGESAQALIDRADEALYRAKRGGRDRVEFALDDMS